MRFRFFAAHGGGGAYLTVAQELTSHGQLATESWFYDLGKDLRNHES